VGASSRVSREGRTSAVVPESEAEAVSYLALGLSIEAMF
jgi:hypothetical protein